MSENTCQIPMKVNLGTEPFYFIIYFGRFFKIPKYHSLKSFIYQSTLMFDETGQLLKNKDNAAEFTQDLYDTRGLVHFKKIFHDFTEKDPDDIIKLLNTHKNSVIDYKTYNEFLTNFKKNSTNEN